ncbi:ELWxxDGT repeat protein [Hyalangium rubrum]|uniref:ELWxxDGT repeat protein n=1 Tax=Hyalangium rubrum TaxID=3103134 RepID=A0ABU5HG50_9BACT|nr:ELWxxDGT repeat protein [Hyalangium sp. s54d21]MDY7232442.1 ELWxxDGT repeat protein [Hyalangium sp. s54d21]
MRVTLIWRSVLLLLCGLYGVAVGCGPLSEDDGGAGLARQRGTLDNQCSPPERVSDIRPGPVGAFPDAGVPARVAANGVLYFAANDGTTGQELWRSDGTAQGTYPVMDVRPGPQGSAIERLTAARDGVYFTALDGTHGRELWKSDGTDAGTRLVEDLEPGPANPGVISNLTAAGEQLFFSTDDSVLWRTNGRDGGTVRVKDIILPRNNVGPIMTGVGDTLLFAGDDAINGLELWKSGGTPETTVLLKDLRFRESSGPDWFVTMNGKAYFNADDGPQGREFWTSDGTAAGTFRIKDIWRGLADSVPSDLVVTRNRMYFSADDGVTGPNLWVSDGTTDGTVLVKDLTQGILGPRPRQLTGASGQVFFRLAEEDREVLWRSDGTDAGTYPLMDVLPQVEEADLQEMVGVGGTLYFATSDGVHGTELWKSDGTPEGTVQIMDLYPGDAGSNPRGLTLAGSKFFFVATEPTLGDELWAFDICDRSPPRLTCPPGFSFEATSLEGATVNYSVFVTDDLTENPVVEYSHPSGSAFPVGVTPVTVTARDEAGNNATCTIPVSVQDTEPPAITCPRSMFLEPTGPEGAEIRYPEVKVADKASPVQLVFEPPAGTVLPPGESTRVVLTASDNSGNKVECQFNVAVDLLEDGDGEGGSSGCGCGAHESGAVAWAALLLLLALARPRRAG